MPGIIRHDHFTRRNRQYTTELSEEDWEVILGLPWSHGPTTLLNAFHMNQNSPISGRRAEKFIGGTVLNDVFRRYKLPYRHYQKGTARRLYKFFPKDQGSRPPGNPATVVVYLVLRNFDNQILLAMRKNTGYADGNYQFPAGHVDPEETPTGALIREMREELDIYLRPNDLKLVHVSFRPKHDTTGNRVDFYFEATRWEGDIVNNEPEKCGGLLWDFPNDLPSNTTPHVRVAIEAINRGEVFSELGLDWIKAQGLYRL